MWDNKKYIMGASCYTYDFGLTAKHAYTLIGAYTLNGERVFKMRNPWHSEKYTGPWSDNDKRWTPSLRRQVGSVVANDGIFFFPVKYFLGRFTQMSLGYYNENWQQVSYLNKG
jgi:hypothetical protein